MIIKGTITRLDIGNGQFRSLENCPLGLSLMRRGYTEVVVSPYAITLYDPKKQERLVGAVAGELREWIWNYDARETVEPIKYRLEMQ